MNYFWSSSVRERLANQFLSKHKSLNRAEKERKIMKIKICITFKAVLCDCRLEVAQKRIRQLWMLSLLLPRTGLQTRFGLDKLDN